jgi:Tfp pilus assembly protein PilZ
MFEFIFDLPLIITGPVIVGSLCLFAIVGLLLVRRLVLPRLRVHHEDAHEGAEAVMEAARSSPSNSRCIIYGIGGNAQEAMRYSKYGINAMFSEPLERPAALKLIRATRMLVLHEFRRYVRIPVMTEVSLVGDGRRVAASSIEISSGGMSIKSAEDFSIGTNVEISFALMTLPRVNLKGYVSWRKPKSLGVRFDAADDRRQKIKTWIDSYLEN